MADPANSVVKITEIEGRGRAVVACRAVKAGEIVLRDSPLLLYNAIPSNKTTSTSDGCGTNPSTSCYCANCFRCMSRMDPSSLLTCPSCSHGAVFCSPSCHSMALNTSHTPWVCQALSTINTSTTLDPDSQVQAHFLVAAYDLAFRSPSDFNLLLSLQGGEGESGSRRKEVDTKTLALHSLISSLCPPQASSPGFSPQLTAALLAKDEQNAFGLMEPFHENSSIERNVRAYAIYPKASFFNHDCLPNACRFDYVDGTGESNTDIIVRAIHDIPEGREICLSYFPVNWNFRDRQQRLKEDYGFACRCDRCEIEVKWKVQLDDDDNGDDSMQEDKDEPMEGLENGNGVNSHCVGLDDFPHAYFFLSYLCDTENCSGTLAPFPPSEGVPPEVMECNACGRARRKDDIDTDEDDEDEDEDGDGVMLDQ